MKSKCVDRYKCDTCKNLKQKLIRSAIFNPNYEVTVYLCQIHKDLNGAAVECMDYEEGEPTPRKDEAK